MTEQIKSTLIRAMNKHKGENLERAESAFRGLPASAMDLRPRNSGYTRGEILARHRKRRAEWTAAMDWLETQQAEQ